MLTRLLAGQTMVVALRPGPAEAVCSERIPRKAATATPWPLVDIATLARRGGRHCRRRSESIPSGAEVRGEVHAFRNLPPHKPCEKYLRPQSRQRQEISSSPVGGNGGGRVEGSKVSRVSYCPWYPTE